MSRLAALHRNLTERRQVDQDLDEEVRAFYDVIVERYISRGLSREEATRIARLELEGPEQVKEKVREQRIGVSIEIAARDLQYAWRTLRRSPAFTAVAVITLGLGIGANTAIFTLINAVMLLLLPVQDPEQLVLLTDPAQSGVSVETTEHGIRSNLSYAEFQELRKHNQVFSGLAAAENDVDEVDVYRGDSHPPIKAHTELVSGNFFQVLGVEPVLGRVFTSEEDRRPGANPVAVISHGYWERHFAGNPSVIGSHIRVGQGIFQIIGVAPANFHGVLVGSGADLWFPLTMQQQVLPGRDYLTPRDTLWLQVIGRLAPGVSLKAAQAGINVAFQQTLRSWAPDLPTARERREMVNERIVLRPGARGASALRGEFGDPLLLLMTMVGVVLMVACSNVANLLMARASGRRQEIGVRLALGAARRRLIRQLFTESLLLAVLGGLLGLVVSLITTRLLLALVSTGISDLDVPLSPDWHVLAFTAGISLLTGIVFGLAPAVRGTRLDISPVLASNARGATAGRGRTHLDRILTIAQVALALVLVIGAGLFVRTLQNMLLQRLGYDRDHLLMITVDPRTAGYKGPSAVSMYETLREQLQTVPGVRAATVSNRALFAGDSGDHLSIEGSPEKDPEKLVSAWTEVGADYFRTLRLPLLRGREIDSADAWHHAPVCVINETFLHRYYPDGVAIGKHITDEYPTTRETFEIVGVVPDSIEHWPTEKKHPRFYANLSHAIGSVGTVTYLLSTPADPARIAAPAQKVVRQFDRNLPVVSVRTVNQQINTELITQRLLANLAAFFSGLTLLIAAVGLYGVMSYSISRRTGEIGIRMALGASATGVVSMVFAESLAIVAAGVAIGLPTAIGSARIISSRLYGVTPADPVVAGTAVIVILAAAILAVYVPARRASQVDPAIALRNE